MVAGPSTEVARIRQKMQQDIQELYRENIMAEEASNRAQQDHESREQELQDKLLDLRRAFASAKRNMENMRVQIASLNDEVNRARKSELRYKKKVRLYPQTPQWRMESHVMSVLRFEARSLHYKENGQTWWLCTSRRRRVDCCLVEGPMTPAPYTLEPSWTPDILWSYEYSAPPLQCSGYVWYP